MKIEALNTIIIMGGIPGSGKSFESKKIQTENPDLDSVIFSTDDFWITPDGEYKFDFNKIATAHKWNVSRTESAMKDGISLIIIDNTNTTPWERAPYEKLAESYGYKIEYCQSSSPWWIEIYKNMKSGLILDEDVQVLYEKNTHGVPKETIKKMMQRYNFPE
jgi:predicted kinase